jgi:metal-dependent amidase/aminoacylase/carboxypeptidase family protein
MFLTDRDLAELIGWRRELHRRPKPSGQEAGTARKVEGCLAATGADRIVAGLGGHGVAAVYEGAALGPTVMFRAELDGLPIEEISEAAHRSAVPGKAHPCGHDGYMATSAALARGLERRRPGRGRAVLLFQPAEENGAGGGAVLAGPRFVAFLRRALDAEGVPHDGGELPMRGSEDFGRFGRDARAASFFLGVGEKPPSLHSLDHDYPGELIAVGARVLMRTSREPLG